MKYRKYPHWVIITNKEIPFPYTDALSRLYEDIPRDRIGTEEMVDGINNEEDNEFSDKYLSTIEFQADEEIERELNLEDEAKRTYPFKPPSIPRTHSTTPHVMAKAKETSIKEMQTRPQLPILQI
jgi:hypothetical protein